MNSLRDKDRRLARRAIAWGPPWLRRGGLLWEEAVEHTKLWWAAGAAMAALGGPRGRRAAAAGIAAMATAEALSHGIKQLHERRRPPRQWVPPDALRERPDSSSFPSGHTAAAVAFTAAVMLVWSAAGAACGTGAALVAAQRLHSGAHYPSDVAAGCAIGLAGAGLVQSAPRLLAVGTGVLGQAIRTTRHARRRR